MMSSGRKEVPANNFQEKNVKPIATEVYNFSFVLSCLQLYTAEWCKKFSAAGRIHHVYLGKPYSSYRTIMQDVMLKLFFL